MIKYFLLANTFSNDILSTCLYVYISPHLDDHRSLEHPVFVSFHNTSIAIVYGLEYHSSFVFYFIFLKLRFSLTLTPCVLVAMLSCSGEIVKKRYRNIVYPFTQMFQSGWLYFFFVSLFLKSVMFSKLSSFMPFLSLRDLQLKKCKIMARHSFFFYFTQQK